MKPDWLDPSVWVVNDEDREMSFVEFVLTGITFVVALAVVVASILLIAARMDALP